MKTIVNVLVVIIATGLLTTNTNAVGSKSPRVSKLVIGVIACCEKIKCDISKCVPLGMKKGVRQCYCKE